MNRVAGRLRLDLAQYRELMAFAQFASELDKATQAQLGRGERMVEILKQPQYQPMPVEEQVMIIYTGTQGFLDDLPVESIKRFESGFLQFMREKHPEVGLKIKDTKTLDRQTETQLKDAVEAFKSSFKATE